MIAAIGGNRRGHYNGKIEALKVYKAAIDPTQSEDGMASHWDRQEISTKRIVDAGPLDCTVKSKRAGAQRKDRTDRGRDALEARARNLCRDPFSRRRYRRLRMGDGFQLHGARGAADRPQRVFGRARIGKSCLRRLSAKGAQTADVCVLIPTFTYTIYGNQARRDFGDEWPRRAKISAFPYNPIVHRSLAFRHIISIRTAPASAT